MPVIAEEKQIAVKSNRIHLLDSLRGGAMLLVILYHILYDLKFMYGVNIPRIITPGSPETEFVHTCFLWVLFAVSGICSGFSKNSLKRGSVLYIIGYLITVGSSIFVPSQLIVFGVLSCFGACMVITSLIKPLTDRLPWQLFLAISLVLWCMFFEFHRSGSIHLLFWEISFSPYSAFEYLYPLGIKGADFHSADYFPVIPYIFMFWTGAALYRPVSEHKLPDAFYGTKKGALSFIGKHSLIIYAVHQPVILLIMEIFF